jgi:endonuclease/exonuclease/phosphatase family metal-dependent hydrolase
VGRAASLIARAAVAAGWVVVAVLAVLAIIQLAGEDGLSSYTVLAAALTPVLYLPAYVVLIAAGIARKWSLAIGAVPLIAIHLVWVVPDLVESGHHGTEALRVVEANVYYLNHDATTAARDMLAQRPDIVTVAEVSPTTERALESVLSPVLPHHVDDPSGASGVGIWSRYPLREVVDVRATGLPLIEADVQTPAGRVRVYAVHVDAPVDSRRAWANGLRRVATIVADRPPRAIVAGDFNATQWNADFRSVLHTGLHDTRDAGNWWEPTWPHAFLKLPPLLPIDHVLVPHGIDAVSSRTFVLHGSDHRGLAVGLGGPLLAQPPTLPE